MPYLTFTTTTRLIEITDIHTTQALADAHALAQPLKSVWTGFVSVPIWFGSGYYLKFDGTVTRASIIKDPEKELQTLARYFLYHVVDQYIVPMYPQRERWLREQNLTEADITTGIAKLETAQASTVTDRTKRIIQVDYWLKNCVLIPHVSMTALNGLRAEGSTQTDIVAKMAEVRADNSYAYNEVQIGGTNAIEFWYDKASLQFIFYKLGVAWITGRGANLGSASEAYKTVVKPPNWNITKAVNDIRAWGWGVFS